MFKRQPLPLQSIDKDPQSGMLSAVVTLAVSGFAIKLQYYAANAERPHPAWLAVHIGKELVYTTDMHGIIQHTHDIPDNYTELALPLHTLIQQWSPVLHNNLTIHKHQHPGPGLGGSPKARKKVTANKSKKPAPQKASPKKRPARQTK